MSALGDLIRLPLARRERIRLNPSGAYDEVSTFWPPERLELDWEWKPFGILFDAAGFSVNPFRSGALFPDPETAFGADCDSRTLDPSQVAEVADLLTQMSFEVLCALLRDALVEWCTVRVDHDFGSPTYGQALSPHQVVPAAISDAETEKYRVRLAGPYADLATFYRAAARDNECTVFWAA